MVSNLDRDRECRLCGGDGGGVEKSIRGGVGWGGGDGAGLMFGGGKNARLEAGMRRMVGVGVSEVWRK
jgi:hypothetical protein